MSIALVQEADTPFTIGTSSTVTISPSGNGNLLVVEVVSTSIFPTTVTDSNSTSYTHINAADASYITGGNTVNTSLWYLQNCASGITSITANMASSQGINIFALEYSGVKISAALDVSGTISSGVVTGKPLGPSMTTTADGDVIISLEAVQAISITGVDSPFTIRSTQNGNGLADYIGPVAGTYQASFDPSGTTQWAGSGASFFAAPPSPLTNSSMFLVF